MDTQKNKYPILYIHLTLILSELDKMTEDLPFFFRMRNHKPFEDYGTSFLTFWSEDSFLLLKVIEDSNNYVNYISIYLLY